MSWKVWLPSAGLLGALVAWASPGDFFPGWLAASLLWLPILWTLARAWHNTIPRSRTLGAWLLIGLALRLGAGMFYANALPTLGYESSPVQQAGYLFEDAFERDTQAWELATSGAPLRQAFSRETSSDQYGGLLFLSALLYRVLSPDAHRPLLIILPGIWLSLLGMIALYRLARIRLGEAAAGLSIALYACYPEGVLLAASQMREPWLMGAMMLLLWGSDVRVRAAARPSPLLPLAGFVLLLTLSPGVAAFGALAILLLELVQRPPRAFSWKAWLGSGLAGILGLALFARQAARSGVQGNNPLSFVLAWLQRAAAWDLYLTTRQSGWMQKLLGELPGALHLPFVTAFGLAQPALPATLIEPSLPLWHVTGGLRAAGWYLLAPALLLAIFVFWQKRRTPEDRWLLTLTLLVWAWVLLASLRAGGDQWDNPRYRTILLGWQALLAAGAWLQARQSGTPWRWRILSAEVIFLAFFTQWYLSRYTGLVRRLPFWQMLAAIVGSTLLAWLGEALWRFWQARRPNHR